jgi:hypothetical protein
MLKQTLSSRLQLSFNKQTLPHQLDLFASPTQLSEDQDIFSMTPPVKELLFMLLTPESRPPTPYVFSKSPGLHIANFHQEFAGRATMGANFVDNLVSIPCLSLFQITN